LGIEKINRQTCLLCYIGQFTHHSENHTYKVERNEGNKHKIFFSLLIIGWLISLRLLGKFKEMLSRPRFLGEGEGFWLCMVEKPTLWDCYRPLDNSRSLSLLEQNHPRSTGHFWSLSQVISLVSQSGHNSFVLASLTTGWTLAKVEYWPVQVRTLKHYLHWFMDGHYYLELLVCQWQCIDI